MAEKPKFVTITGRPLSGKSEIIKMLLATRKDFEIFKGKSFTTRPPRESDVPGEYEYVTEEDFDLFLQGGEFAWTFSHGNYRVGTRKADIDAALESSRVSVMTLVPEAVAELIAIVDAEYVLPFFIECSEADTYRRFPERTERREESQKTLNRLRETREWRQEMLRLGIMFTLVKNPNEEDRGSTALSEILGTLERRGL
jgi:guanylate kinase